MKPVLGRQGRSRAWALERLTTIGEACIAVLRQTLSETLAWAETDRAGSLGFPESQGTLGSTLRMQKSRYSIRNPHFSLAQPHMNRSRLRPCDCCRPTFPCLRFYSPGLTSYNACRVIALCTKVVQGAVWIFKTVLVSVYPCR